MMVAMPKLSDSLEKILRLAHQAIPFDRGAVHLLHEGALTPLAAWAQLDVEGEPPSSLAVPLSWDGEVIGSLDMVSGEPGFFQPHHVEYAEIVAEQIVRAIDHARLLENHRVPEPETLTSPLLFAEKPGEDGRLPQHRLEEQMRQYLDGMLMVHRVGVLMGGAQNLDHLLSLVCEQAVVIGGARRAALGLLTEAQGQMLRIAAVCGEGSAPWQGRVERLDSSIAEKALAQRQPFLVMHGVTPPE
ncbi:MAG: GAF domain-containing protein, partial [Ardenticatenales bacterium]|nr:GAF domain-containing protein [Ardenticatenales bacterium]